METVLIAVIFFSHNLWLWTATALRTGLDCAWFYVPANMVGYMRDGPQPHGMTQVCSSHTGVSITSIPYLGCRQHGVLLW